MKIYFHLKFVRPKRCVHQQQKFNIIYFFLCFIHGKYIQIYSVGLENRQRVFGVQFYLLLLLLCVCLFFVKCYVIPFLSFPPFILFFSLYIIIIIQFEMNFQRQWFHYCDYVGVAVVVVTAAVVVDSELASNFHR